MSVLANSEQQQVIDNTESPLLVIAGPGAGKTKTLVDRVIHLIVDKKIPSENIMVATFTEKAAKELVTRITNKASELGATINLSDMYVGTLHSIFLRILEEYRQHTNLKRNYRVLDDFEQKFLFYQNAHKFAHIENISVLLKTVYGWSAAENLCELVNKVAEENLDLEKLHNCGNVELAVLSDITQKYRDLLEEQNALDFSLIQSQMWSLLQNETVLSELRSKIKYIMVDEYQDTNRIQEMIVLKLAAPENKICVVGDDDQSLYRFRGATVENILRFQEKFPKGECKKIELNKNYRSHPDVIDFYNRWMISTFEEKNAKGIIKQTGSWEGENGELYRYPKTILNAGKQNRENTKYTGVVKAMGGTEEEWCQNVLQMIQKLRECGTLTDYNQCAFLAKSVKNPHVTKLADYLEEHGIPVFSPRSAMFFQRHEIKLIIGAYVFLFPNLVQEYLNQKYALDVWNYYNDCNKYFGDAIRSHMEDYKELRVWAVHKAKELSCLTENTDYTFANLFYELIQFKPFSELVDTELSSGVQDLRPLYNLSLFSQLLSKFEYLNKITVIPADREKRKDILKKLFNEYFNFLYEGGLEEYEDFDMVTPSGCVSFMTIHQSKGLEFPITFVASLDNSPRKDFDDIDVAIADFYYQKKNWEPLERTKFFDFWRLYYTAFSRAENLLVLTGVDNTFTRKEKERATPSKYFLSVYKGLQEWPVLFNNDKTELILNKVKPTNLKHEYSFTSHILVYENCPVQYKFFKELEFTPVRTNAIMFGSLVHQTIEDVHKKVLEGKSDEITSENIENWLNDNYRQLSKHEGLYLQKHTLTSILKHVNNYVDYASKDWSRVKEAEVPVTLQKEDYILKGTIDLIQGSGNTVEILDFKTDKKPDITTEEGKESVRRYRRQLEIYSHIVQQRYGLTVSKMHLFYTGTEGARPFVSYDFNPSAIEQTINQVTDVVTKIENKDFERKAPRNPKHCVECDLKFMCDHKCK